MMHNRRNSLRIAVSLITLLFAFLVELCAQGNPSRIIDGSPRIFVNGRQWSWGIGMSSNMCAGVGISNWRFVSADSYGNSIPVTDTLTLVKDSWTKNIDYRNVDTPVVMFVYGSGVTPKSPLDTAAINLGVRKLKLLTDTLTARGVDWVFYTTRHRRELRWRDQCRPQDDWFDTCVFKEYSKAVGKQMHADVMTTSIRYYPHTVQSDLEHPAGPLTNLYNTRWLQALYLHDGATPPASLETNLNTSYVSEVNKRKQMVGFTVTSPSTLDTLRMGQKVSLDATIDAGLVGKNNNINVFLVGYRCAVAGIFRVGQDSIPLTSATRSFTFTVPDSAPIWIYQITGKPMNPVTVDSAQIQVFVGGVRGSHFMHSKMFRVADRNGHLPLGISKPLTVVGSSMNHRGGLYLIVSGNSGLIPGSGLARYGLTGRLIDLDTRAMHHRHISSGVHIHVATEKK